MIRLPCLEIFDKDIRSGMNAYEKKCIDNSILPDSCICDEYPAGGKEYGINGKAGRFWFKN